MEVNSHMAITLFRDLTVVVNIPYGFGQGTQHRNARLKLGTVPGPDCGLEILVVKFLSVNIISQYLDPASGAA